MKSLTDTYKLYNGVEIPCLGFGTWQAEGRQAEDAVKVAIAAGYRHIDTATEYGNEENVGRGIRGCDISRKDLFVTTKLLNDDHGYDSTLKAFDLSMEKLGLDYLDLYLIHWPNPIKFRSRWKEINAETWKAFEDLYEAKKIRAIGISNFLPHHIEALMVTAKLMPMANQIRLCPGDTQDEVVNYCRQRGMLIEAYSPLGTGGIFKVPTLQEIAIRNKRTVAQLCLHWSIQRGFLPIPKSVKPARIKENAQIFDFEISDSDMNIINNLKGVAGFADNPDTADW
jgi:diketogulonate reductase-like aldo/keto reductase